MFEKKLKNNIYFSIMLLAVLVAASVFMISRNSSDISQMLGTKEPLGFEYYLILFIFALIFIVCISSLFVLIRQIIRFRKTAFTVDREGIHDTFIGIILFALVIVVPVKLIPWNSVREIKDDDGKLHVKTNSKEVSASPVAKLILKIFGFDFCHGAVTGLDENEKAIITAYCGQIPDCAIQEEEATDESAGYSKKAKAGMIILIIINALFLLLTLLDYSLTAEISCTLPSFIGMLFGATEHPLFAEACQIVENNSSVYFQVYENYLHDIWTVVKTAHVAVTLLFAYLMIQKNPKISSKKLTLYYVLSTVIISLAGMTVLQFAIHNRVEANENSVIISEYGKEDTVITNYKDAEKVKVYITETYGDDRYISYEGAVDVTVKGKTYTFFGTENPDYENMEKFINYFDESIIEIDTTYWDTDEFQLGTYSEYEEILDRIYKK